MTHRIVILGAGYAGLAAATRTARQLHGTDARGTLINAADRFVERVRLHQFAAGQALADLPLRDLLTGTSVEFVVASVTGIDAAARTVRLSGAPHMVGYDTLVYGLGSRADVDTVAGVAEHAFTIAGADGARKHRPDGQSHTRRCDCPNRTVPWSPAQRGYRGAVRDGSVGPLVNWAKPQRASIATDRRGGPAR
jgi:NADH dehydrogenase FAD-containing subunit